jgi:putative phosphoesterase
MNKLTQLDTFLIGSSEDVLALQNADTACILLLSDTHGNVCLVESIVRAFGAQCAALVFCGDGASDVASLLPKAPNEFPPVAALVRGNGDAGIFSKYAAAGSLANNNFACSIPAHIAFNAAGHIVFAAHGHNHGVDYGTEQIARAASLLNADIVFFGHTHRPFKSARCDPLAVNPGSVTMPRGNNPPSFALVTLRRDSFDTQAAFYEIKKHPTRFVPLNL